MISAKFGSVLAGSDFGLGGLDNHGMEHKGERCVVCGAFANVPRGKVDRGGVFSPAPSHPSNRERVF